MDSGDKAMTMFFFLVAAVAITISTFTFLGNRQARAIDLSSEKLRVDSCYTEYGYEPVTKTHYVVKEYCNKDD